MSFKYHTKVGIWNSAPNGSFSIPAGWGNGYIKIPPGHWLHGLHYDKVEELNPPFMVHGGITYAGPEGGFWLLGFDTAHCYDNIENWPKSKVESHTKEWAAAFFDWQDPRENNQSDINSFDNCEVCEKTQGKCFC